MVILLALLFLASDGEPPVADRVARARADCDKGKGVACEYLGDAYRLGRDGLTENKVTAAGFYRRACEREQGIACANVAHLLSTGDGVAQNTAEAGPLYRRAVELLGTACSKGQALECSVLASCYEHGQGVDKSLATSATMNEKACLGGIATACMRLGDMYYTGEGVSEDYDKGSAFYKRACDGGISVACHPPQRTR